MNELIEKHANKLWTLIGLLVVDHIFFDGKYLKKIESGISKLIGRGLK